MTHAFFHASGTEIARMIRNREVTSREVVEAHIRFIERHNPRINAMVVSRFSEARREANAADDAINRGDDLSERPLHGVPCSI